MTFFANNNKIRAALKALGTDKARSLLTAFEEIVETMKTPWNFDFWTFGILFFEIAELVDKKIVLEYFITIIDAAEETLVADATKPNAVLVQVVDANGVPREGGLLKMLKDFTLKFMIQNDLPAINRTVCDAKPMIVEFKALEKPLEACMVWQPRQHFEWNLDGCDTPTYNADVVVDADLEDIYG
jgi:hypothetical protein